MLFRVSVTAGDPSQRRGGLAHIQILLEYLQIWSNCKVGNYVSAVREPLCKEEHMEKNHLLLGEDVEPTWLLAPPLWSGTALLGTPRSSQSCLFEYRGADEEVAMGRSNRMIKHQDHHNRRRDQCRHQMPTGG